MIIKPGTISTQAQVAQAWARGAWMTPAIRLNGWRERASDRQQDQGRTEEAEGQGQIDKARPAQGRGAGREEAKTASSVVEGAIRKARTDPSYTKRPARMPLAGQAASLLGGELNGQDEQSNLGTQ
jgi:hypothetical protein